MHSPPIFHPIPTRPNPTSLRRSCARARMFAPRPTQKNRAQQARPSTSTSLSPKSEQDRFTHPATPTSARTSRRCRSNKQTNPGSRCRTLRPSTAAGESPRALPLPSIQCNRQSPQRRPRRPSSPLAAAQQQPALSSPCSVPFTPFHSLSTTYRIPASSPIKASIPEFSHRPPTIAKEATPPPIVAEAPPSPPVAQQQPAPPSFCPLHFKPFSSLLTSYRVPASLSSPVCVQDLRHQSPPQPHQPTRKPSPADTAEPARSATPVETVLAQALSPAADPEISEECTAHRAEEPEEPERDEEPQEDELSDYASQSSPSLSLPEPSPQCRPSALAFIAPLAESLRAELSAIQDTIAQTGSTAHTYSAALATLADKVDALIALASDLNLRARDSSEQEHAKGFGTLMDRLGELMGSACAVEDSAADGAASNANQSAEDPEEPEQEEELQDDEPSERPSQSSPSGARSLTLSPFRTRLRHAPSGVAPSGVGCRTGHGRPDGQRRAQV